MTVDAKTPYEMHLAKRIEELEESHTRLEGIVRALHTVAGHAGCTDDQTCGVALRLRENSPLWDAVESVRAAADAALDGNEDPLEAIERIACGVCVFQADEHPEWDGRCVACNGERPDHLPARPAVTGTTSDKHAFRPPHPQETETPAWGPSPEPLKDCSQRCPPTWTGHWREFHRGHGCKQDPEVKR
jgi:hypothetical protein